MFGPLYDRALDGERCWVRHDDGRVHRLPVHRWLDRHPDRRFDRMMIELCAGPTIDLGCGPGRLVTQLMRRGIPALGIDRSGTAIKLARRCGAPVLRRDVFAPLPGVGCWHTVLLADGNVGLGGDPWRILRRAGELLCCGGRCIAEFDAQISGIHTGWVRLESSCMTGPWFRWATVGIDCAARLADEVGLTITDIRPMGSRVLAQLATSP